MRVFLLFFTYSLSSFLLAFFFGCVFIAAVRVGRPSWIVNRENGDICSAVGVSVITTACVISAQLGVNQELVFFVFAIAALVGVFFLFRLKLRTSWRWLWNLYFCCLIATSHYWTVFRRFSLGLQPTVFSNANNDIALYILGGDNFQIAGFQEAGRVTGYTIGSTTRFDAAGSSALIAFGSWVSRLPVWRIAIPVMILLTALTLQMLIALVNRLVGRRTHLAWLIGTWAIFSNFGARSQSNYFLNQSLSRLFMVLSLVLLVDIFLSEKRRGITVLCLSLTISASLSCYASGAVVIFLGFSAVLVALSVQKLIVKRISFRELVKDVRLALMSLILGVIISSARLPTAIEHIRFYSRGNITGWPAPTDRWNQLISFEHANQIVGWFGAAAVFVLIVFAFWSLVHNTEHARSLLGSALSFSFLVGIFMATLWHYGNSTYQTWKMLVSLQPLFIVFFGILIVTSVGRKRNFRALISFLFLVIAGINWQNAQRTWLDVVQVPDIATSKIFDGQSRTSLEPVSIVLNPYLETMIAPVVANIFSSSYGTDTYIGGPAPLTSCILTRQSESTNTKEIVLRSSSVVLLRNPACFDKVD
jgi:hypothetical protein